MKQQLRVRRGYVECPLRGQIDVELCFYCKCCDAVDLDSRHPKVSCHPEQPSSQQERQVYERLSLLQMAELEGNVSKVCREHNVSRHWFYTLKRRYDKYGLDGLRSHKSKS